MKNIKWIHGLVLLSIIGAGAWVGWTVYSVLFDLAQFQIDMYAYFIKFSVSVENVGVNLNQNLAELFSRLGSEKATSVLESGKYAQQVTNEVIEERIATYTSKVLWFCRLIGTLIGIGVYTLLRKVVFTIDTHFQAVYRFITRK